MSCIRTFTSRIGGAAAVQGARALSTEAPSKATEYLRHRTTLPINGVYPHVSAGAFVAPSAVIAGNVKVGQDCSIWYNAVVRGDKNKVEIDGQVSVGDRATLLTVESLGNGFPAVLELKDQAIVRPGATLVSCIVEERAVIGENAVVLEGALVEKDAVVGPNSVVPPGRRIPAGEHWAGNPVEFVGKVDLEEKVEELGVETYAKTDHEGAYYMNPTAFTQLKK